MMLDHQRMPVGAAGRGKEHRAAFEHLRLDQIEEMLEEPGVGGLVDGVATTSASAVSIAERTRSGAAASLPRCNRGAELGTGIDEIVKLALAEAEVSACRRISPTRVRVLRGRVRLPLMPTMRNSSWRCPFRFRLKTDARGRLRLRRECGPAERRPPDPPPRGAAAAAVTGRSRATRPSRRTTTRSASATASATSWVMRMVVKRCSPQMRSSRRCISIRVSASRAPNGSSRRRTPGRLTRARARATRCRWPPERTAGQSWARSARPTSLSAASAASRQPRLSARCRHCRGRAARGGAAHPGRGAGRCAAGRDVSPSMATPPRSAGRGRRSGG